MAGTGVSGRYKWAVEGDQKGLGPNEVCEGVKRMSRGGGGRVKGVNRAPEKWCWRRAGGSIDRAMISPYRIPGCRHE